MVSIVGEPRACRISSFGSEKRMLLPGEKVDESYGLM